MKTISSVNIENSKNLPKSLKSTNDIIIPSIYTKETLITAKPRRIFANAHAYHINSISLNRYII